MHHFVEDLPTSVAPAGAIHLTAGPAVPVYVIIMIVVRGMDQVFI